MDTKIKWYPASEPPDVKKGCCKKLIFGLETASGKKIVSGGSYLNRYEIEIESTGENQLWTGFFNIMKHPYFDEYYEKIEEPLKFWAEYPKFPVENECDGFKYSRTETYSCNDQTHAVKEYKHEKTGMEFVLIPAGTFLIGDYYLTSMQKVAVSSFLISKCVVTQGVWKRIMGNKPWKGKAYVKEGENYPAVYVSWNDAKEFCSKTGLYLPTESQWEYACRAGTTTKYYWGNDMDGDYAWYDKNSCDIGDGYAHEVGKKKSNAFGLCDMSGNVWEWCEDSWHDNYNGAPVDGSAWIETSASRYVNRGGSFYNIWGEYCSSAVRYGDSPDFCDYRLGFRVCGPC